MIRSCCAPGLPVILLLAACGAGEHSGSEEAVARPWPARAVTELEAMAERDQEVRAGLTPETAADTAFLARMARADTTHTRRLRALVDSFGWPGADTLGRAAVEAAFLLVQHATDSAWQRRLLPVIESDVQAGRLNPQDYALLVDRTRQKQGLLQLYGTQLSLTADGRATLDPIEDSAGVDERRAGLGLPSLAVYLDLIEEQTGFDVVGHDRREGRPRRE